MKYYSLKEASKILLEKINDTFGDQANPIDIAARVYNNPHVKTNPEFNWQIKAVEDVLKYPEHNLHHRKIWEWGGLKLAKVFEELN